MRDPRGYPGQDAVGRGVSVVPSALHSAWSWTGSTSPRGVPCSTQVDANPRVGASRRPLPGPCSCPPSGSPRSGLSFPNLHRKDSSFSPISWWRDWRQAGSAVLTPGGGWKVRSLVEGSLGYRRPHPVREGSGGRTKEEQREASGGSENSIGPSLLWGPTAPTVAFWVGNRVAGWQARVAGRSWSRMGISPRHCGPGT